ncbi:MAG: hypothetical protein ACREFA_06775 [Stellaceae bacterium]
MGSNALLFWKAAIAAFPRSSRALAMNAARILAPFVDNDHCKSPFREITLGNNVVKIPYRIHFDGLKEAGLQSQDDFWVAAQCLCTRSTDGYMRQTPLRHILGIGEDWIIPFVVLLSGEYVVEITEDIAGSLTKLDRNRYINFVRENRPVMRLLRSKATSYWDRYYRHSYPDRCEYPGLMFLHELELWAS